MFDHPRARRPVRALRGAARNRAPDLRRGARAFAPGAGGVRRAGARHARARLRPEMAARGHLVDAEAALSHHGRVHAQERPARPRHDAAHLHGAGQSRLSVRSRHGEEVPGEPGLAAGGDGAVRQLAVCRGPAHGPPEPAQPGVDRHRPRPLRHPPLCLRAGLRVRALCRLHARRADVLRLPRRPLHRRERPVVPRFPRRHGCRRCRAKSRGSATGPTI